MIYYYRFCCAMHYFFERKMKYENAEIFTFFFTVLILFVNSFSIFLLFQIIANRRITIPDSYKVPIFLFFCLLNYLLAFKNSKYLKYERSRYGNATILLIVVFSYLFLGIFFYFSKIKISY